MQAKNRPRFERQKSKTRVLDNVLTPLEIAKLSQSATHEDFPFAILPLLEHAPPVSYRRETLSEDVIFYTADRGARNLIVAFCGIMGGLMIPVSYFLQMLRDDEHDVLLIRDRRKLHFQAGIEGFSDSFLGTVRLIEAFAGARTFRTIITYGSSMGGLPALRAGLLLKAKRAVSVGGRFCWPVERLRRGNQFGGFDLLCACQSQCDLPMLDVFGAANEEDEHNYNILSRILPRCRALRIDTASHNVVHVLDIVGLLPSFYAYAFDAGDIDLDVVPTFLSAVVAREQSARFVSA